VPDLENIRATLSAYPIEVPFPDIGRWRNGNVGIEYLHCFDSGVAGPHILLLALVHGNEVTGAIAVDTLLDAGLRPIVGRLSFGFANVSAYERFDRNNPDASRFIDEDMNRVWSQAILDGTRDSVELRRARAMRPFIDTVDLLLDLHSMHEASEALMMCGPHEKGLRLAATLGYPEHVVVDAGHSSGTRLRDYGNFGEPGSKRNALLIEAGQHFSKGSAKVALDVACRFLLQAGVVRACDVQPFVTESRSLQQRFVEITHPIVAKSMEFTFAEPFKGLEVIPRAGTVIARDGDLPIVTPYGNCLVVQPSLRQLSPGNTVMRLGRFMDEGRRGRSA